MTPSITLLIPSRGRPPRLKSAVDSARDTADQEIEILTYLDDDDPCLPEYATPAIIGPRVGAAGALLQLLGRVTTPYLMLCSDDVIFRTGGWDTKFVDAMPADDLAVLWSFSKVRTKCFHPFTSMKWHALVGLFPAVDAFRHFGPDGWMVEIATMCDRLIAVDAVIEHMHYKFGKSEEDDTYRQARHDSAAQKAVDYMASTKAVRREHANRILKAIENARA